MTTVATPKKIGRGRPKSNAPKSIQPPLADMDAQAIGTVKDKRGRPKSNAPKLIHPPYADMVAQAIGTMKDKRGSSGIAIKKYIMTHFDVADSTITNKSINLSLKRGVTSGALVTARGHAGTFRNSQEAKKAAAKSLKKNAVTPKKAAGRPKAKQVAKKAVKRPLIKKSLVKAKKSPVKAKKPLVKAKKTPTKVKPKKATPKKVKKPAKAMVK